MAGRGRELGILVVLAVGSVVARLPFQSEFLVNFDSVNFAFGVEGFDLERHEPHPPGYLGYVVVARVVDAVVGDANRSLTLLSMVSAGVATALVFLIVRRHTTRHAAVLAAVLFGLSPLTWYYGIVGLSYLPGAALVLAIVWACHRARFDPSPTFAYVAAVLLAGLGAMRQTDILLFAPLLWFATAPLGMKVRLRAAAVVAVSSLPWLIPLLVLSGGPVQYVELSRDLAVLAGGRTSVFGLDLGGLARNFRLVGTGAVLGLFAALIPLALVARRVRCTRDEKIFLAAWTVPSLLVFLFVHTGQLGYVLPVLPAAYVLLARGLDASPALFRDPGRLRRVAVVAAVLVLIDVVGFSVLPGRVLDAARDEGEIALPAGAAIPMPETAEIRPIDVAANDEHWRALIGRAEETDPETTAILALPNTSVSFRHLAFYLRDHTVYAVGQGRDGRFGHLFTAQDGETDYSVDGLADPDRTLDLPSGTTQVLLFDLDRDAVDIGAPARWERLDDDTDAVRITVPDGATLSFSGRGDAGLGIDVVGPDPR